MSRVQGCALIILTVLSSGNALKLYSKQTTGPSADLWERLWNGEDVEPEESKQVLEFLRFDSASDLTKHDVQMLGPPDSGTHLLHAMLAKNFPTRIGSIERLWKHSLGGTIPRAKEIIDGYAHMQNLSETTLIISTRSPIAQLMAWHGHAYSLSPCMKRPFENWDEPCFSNTSPTYHDTTPGVKVWQKTKRSLEFSSSVDVYNQYLLQYKDLKESGKFKDVILLPMEDVILTPEKTFEMVAAKLGWPVPKNGIRTVDADVKKMDDSAGRTKALQKLQSRPFLQLAKTSTGASMVPKICAKLDRRGLEGLKEGSFTDSPIPYGADCHAH